MRLITRDDIERWADRFDSKANLPILIAKLIRATTSNDTQIDFPSGSAVFVGGWDGIVTCQIKAAYVPTGISLWELGTEENPKGQAERNYLKRTIDSLGHDISKRTFIFITARFWKEKNKWKQEKLNEGEWNDIEVYDSSDLEQWLDTSPGVLRWLANCLKMVPYDGIELAEEFWSYWSIFENIKLTPEIVLSGRKKEQEEIFNFLQGPASIKSVKAATKNEAIAFIIATAKLLPIEHSERFFSKTLIISNEGHYKETGANFNSPLNLIPTFENRLPLYSAVSNNHHVIVPLGADDNFNQNTMTLPTIERDGQVDSLISCGFSREEAVNYSKEAGRDITILKKLLHFPHNKVKWLQTKDIREIIPALLIGRWNEKHKGDIELIEKLSGKKYDDYVFTLTKWQQLEESPLIKIGETWRLTSPLDAWINLSSYITKCDLDL